MNGELAPAAHTQRGLWFEDQVRRESGADPAALHSVLALRLPADTRTDALGTAVTALLDRHAALRTAFRWERGELRQVVRPAEPVKLCPEAADGGLTDRMRARFAEPFGLSGGALVRTHLIDAAGDGLVLLIVAHHLLVDEYSLHLLHHDLAELYAAAAESRPSALSPLPATFADIAANEAARDLHDDLDRLAERIRGAPPILGMPLDRPRPRRRDHRGGQVEVRLPGSGLTELARKLGTTTSLVLLTALQIELARWCAQTDLVVGVAMANRALPESAAVVGPFVNLVPVRARVHENRTFAEQVLVGRTGLLHALAHQHVPFDRLVERVGPTRVTGCSPLFQVVLNDLSAMGPAEAPAFGERIPFDYPETAQFDLVAEVCDEDVLTLSYAADIFDHGSVERMGNRLATLLEWACQDAHRPLASGLDQWPAGKPKRADQADPIPASDRAAAHAVPRSPVQELVAAVWSDVLDVPTPDARANFFNLGGHSLTCTQVAVRLSTAVGRPVPISLIFERPILTDLAAEVERLMNDRQP